MNNNMDPTSPVKPRAWIPVLAFIAMLLGFCASGFLQFKHHSHEMKREAMNGLAAVANLKVGQINRWMDSQRQNAELISHDNLLIDEVERWFQQGAPEGKTAQKIRAKLASLRQVYDCDSIALLDREARLRLIVGNDKPESEDKELVIKAMRDNAVTRSDIHWSDDQNPELDFVAPLAVSDMSRQHVIGAVILNIDPDAFLFPYIQSWPTKSPSGETLLVRRDGNEILHLNELRFRKGAALRLRTPIDQLELLTAKALGGQSGELEGIDYRGVPVLAATHKVGDTSWILMAKQDRAEVEASLHSLMVSTAWQVGLFLFLSGTIAAVWWRKQQAQYLAALAEGKLQRLVLEQRFDYATKYARDMLFLIDETGQILECNDAAVAHSGYSRDDLLQFHHYKVLLTAEMYARLLTDLVPDRDGLGAIFESEFQRKDGSTFPVEISARQIEISGKIFNQAIVRDISKRKANEKRIQRLTNSHIALSQCNETIVRCTSEEELFQNVCRIAVQFGGMKIAWIGFIDTAASVLRAATCFGDDTEFLRNITIPIDDNMPFGLAPLGATYREDQPYWCQDFLNNSVAAPWREHIARYNLAASASLPLHRNGVVVGAFILFSGEANTFDEQVRELLIEIAADISFALDNFDRESQRKQAEIRLKESEHRYRAIVQGSMDGFLAIDDKGRFVDVNDAYCQLLGYSREELLKMRIPDVDAQETPEETAQHIEEVLRNGQSRFETRQRCKDGKLLDIGISCVCQQIAGRNYLFSYLRDITASKQHMQTLQAAEERFRCLVKQSITGIYIIQDGKFAYVNPRFAEIRGFTTDELIGKDPLPFIAEKDRSTVAEINRRLLAGEVPSINYSFTALYKDGSSIEVGANSSLATFHNRPAIIGMLQDITERQRAQEALKASEERYRAAFQTSFDAVNINRLDDGTYIDVNEGFLNTMGFEREEVVGRTSLELNIWADPRDRQKLVEGLRKNSSYRNLEAQFRKKNGELIWGLMSASVTEIGGIPCILSVTRDITEIKRAEEQMQQHVKQIETTLMGTVNVATILSEMRDPYTAGHERRVAEIAVAISAELGFDEKQQEGLRVAGHLHDIGKITIPSEILSKPGKLSAIEYQLIKGHAQSGYDVLKDVEFPWPVAQVALQHHERMDGSGYPQGLKGEAILLEARILAVADVVEAMASHRPYRAALGIETALAEIERGSGSAYDPVVVTACLKLFREKGYTLPA